MTASENLIPGQLCAAKVRKYIEFDGRDAVSGQVSSQARLQSEGVAALWHLIATRGYGYLGDEVGMGKTRQAMGVIATCFLSRQDAHVVIVCPGRTLQEQWVSEWSTFIRTCYSARDDRLVSALTGEPLRAPVLHDRLRDFAKALLLNEERIHLLRYSSFSRPIWFNKEAKTPAALLEVYKQCLREIGVAELSDEESAILRPFAGSQFADDQRAKLTADLNEAYAKRVGQLLKSRLIDLAVIDEAQYLRHIGNRQNTNIRHVLRTHVDRWLFMSATPLHTSPDDIKSLDHYLCRLPDAPAIPQACPACTVPPERCARISVRMAPPGGGPKLDVVDILKEILVRRSRTYQDADKKRYLKLQYRAYRRIGVNVASDPLYALTMALVQKRLVTTLDGRNNRFRQGECSSFESLSSSLKRMVEDHDGNASDPEIEVTETDRTEKTPDRSLIDDLNKSFRTAIWGDPPADTPREPQYDMPHAKLREVAQRLFDDYLATGSNRKALVFVRRVDTVDELSMLLLGQFQKEVDGRLEAWRKLLADWDRAFLREDLWSPGGFFTSRDEEADDALGDDEGTESESDEQLLDTAGLPYFAARRKQKGAEPGMFSSFHGRLLRGGNRVTDNPFRGFLLTPDPAQPTMDPPAVAAFKQTEGDWHRFLEAVLEKPATVLAGERSQYAWLFKAEPAGSELFWKQAVLKRCLLMSLRQADFLVDLYVMNRYIKEIGHAGVDVALVDKLLWFLGTKRTKELPEPLASYASNWKQKLRLWIDHFDLIADKSLRAKEAVTWAAIFQRLDVVFSRMAPAFGRSGRLTDANAVPQFKFPTHPNVLVCTDVLKEGVDMHLFCDEVIHYGVAWTSGDLEQRIGRIDRFGSLISRRIERYTAEGEPQQPLPRLQVEFPYLDGTLDRLQVERVIRDKVKSDLRMDLGKRDSEMGEISLDDLSVPKSVAVTAEENAVPGHSEFFPLGVPGDSEEVLPVGRSSDEAEVARFREWYEGVRMLAPEVKVTHLPALGAVAMRRPVAPGENRFLRRSLGANKRREEVTEEEFLLRFDLDQAAGAGPADPLPEPLPSPTEALRARTPTGLFSLSGACKFQFEPRWNTLAAKVRIKNPFDGGAPRYQSVLLERLPGFWLLRTPVFAITRDREVAAGNWNGWILQQNKDRQWGFWLEESKIVWFAAFVLEEGNERGSLFLERVKERVGKIGDRAQHLFLAADNEEVWAYRARALFPEFPNFGAAAAANVLGPDKVSMRMGQEEFEQCGQFLANLHRWFEVAFNDVLNSLYANVPAEKRGLYASPVTYREGGVLHLRAEGQERFSLQVFLQLGGAADPAGVCPGPRMIWELGASTAQVGPKPQIVLSSWEMLPHQSTEGWSSAPDGNCAVFTREDKYRYLVLYHTPDLWDGGRDMLQCVWMEALSRLRNVDKSLAWCRRLFITATTVNGQSEQLQPDSNNN
ncbi:MAG: DEAD/DEAH box helicase family protein [Chromatiaceae bacterium]|nr:DEAD/DEAH box helicase family protein [Chromatiaceae bacterium]MBP6733232.1 DEAD/DEAH box helicase family protein [Chromatiaceae bacterium]MBP6806800.1 DEAD/DEAH box helicase family protein [Chromatiaceae bacterium]MBP8282335.1 DEAD/DEAH box helicase family protein [Chromatiaceae bacterium]MBP8288278.1 DEAD/DEAH box helicase family protein [Chromatiaceae bacterium]